ncbi:flavin-containing monooxygenase [Intrasporangium sp.]|uniref:flavin-containing monooxygenase n=1 Tax=Intrasporangium sp. TaxID=1925024 RepID=UPI00293A390A|nr:NAD(P)-binding domain-containing protein [Intrasporangium sp.]MDV3220938.1 NAD(P)/FAD-dependent oxidoreductase [Intrasporangium sp.]
MHTQHIETVIIGAGQAGLATGYHLQQRGRSFVILDSEQRVGDGWRHQWDTLRLYSPARVDALPGMPFPAKAWSYPTKDEFADYLEAYAAEFRLPVRLGTRVLSVTAPDSAAPGSTSEHAGYAITTDHGQLHADNVVVATGTFGRTPMIPDFADQLDPSIVQLHSSEYRRPGDLPPGPVLVVGASHSGCDIAYELAETHPTILAGRDTGQIPVPFSSPLLKVVFPVMLFGFGHVLTRRTPIGRKQMEHFRFGGGPRLRIQTKDLAARGVDWVKVRVTGIDGGRPTLPGRGALDVRTVIWCTGFRQRFGWIELDIFDEHGWPREMFGVVEEAPGLYFTGLGFQSSARSMLIHGAGPDAARVVREIVRRPSRAEEYRRESEDSWATTTWQPDEKPTRSEPGPRPVST